MKTNIASLSDLSTLVITALLVIGVFKIQQVFAQVDATSSDAVATSSMDATPVDDATTSAAVDTTIPATDVVPTVSPETTPSESVTPIKPPPEGLAEAHIIGMKYIDYFTDGTTITTYPGDPAIDSNFDKPNALIPTHEDLAWDHTTGQNLYDTPSGDLEVGEYAVQPNGSYITNAPPFVSSTSTPAVLGDSTSASDNSSTSTTSDVTDTGAPTTTSTESTATSSDQ